MNSRSAARGFLAFLLSLPVLQGNESWKVTYTSRNVCALRGSTVDINCTYKYPVVIADRPTNVITLWYTKQENDQPVNLQLDGDYAGRVEYSCGEISCTGYSCNGKCSLRIRDLRKKDSAEYKFRVITNIAGGAFGGAPGVMLSVTDQVNVTFPSSTDPTRANMKCNSTCRLAGGLSYIWFRNGQNVEKGIYYRGIISSEDNYSCAVEGYEHLHSPLVYAPKTPLVTVSPSGEIEEGSSVTLSCSSDANPAAKYSWFKEHGDSVGQSGQNYTITHITSKLGGNYYCKSHNAIGRHNSTFLFIILTETAPSSLTTVAVRIVVVVVVSLVTILLVFLWMRRTRATREASVLGEAAETTLPVPVYENLSALTNSSAPSAQREPIELQELPCPIRSETAGPVLCGQL